MTTWNMASPTFGAAEQAILQILIGGAYTTFTSTKVTVDGDANQGFGGWHLYVYPVSGFSQSGDGQFTGSVDHIDVYSGQTLVATLTDIPFGVNYADLDADNPSSPAFVDTIEGTSGNDTIHTLDGQTANGGLGNDSLIGGDGNDGLIGIQGTDNLSGGGGDDLMAIVAGDTANGGDGNDYIIFVGAFGQATIDGGAGSDLLDFSSYGTSAIKVTLGMTPQGSGFMTATGVEAVLGTTFADTIYGSNGDDIVAGLDGNDTIHTGAGNDLIDAGSGNDLIDGGDGVDEVDFSVSQASVVVDLVAGTAVGNYGTETDTLLGVENVDGTRANDTLYGDSNVNVLKGDFGADVLDGRGGADIMIGGDASDFYADTFYVDNVDDVVTPSAGGYVIYSSVNYTTPAGAGEIHLTGVAGLNATLAAGTDAVRIYGNDGANILTGNDGDNVISGGAGNDTMYGGAGNDTFSGTGVDTMTGGAGNDQYYLGDASDTVIEAANGGEDSVVTAFSYTLGANLEDLTVTGTSDATLTGNELNNQLHGNDGNNLIDGGAGNDSMDGGLGNDTYIVDSQLDTVTDSGGIDTIGSNSSYWLPQFAGIETLILTGSDNISGTGTSYSDTIIGNSGNNRLDGYDGSDIMAGGAGDDTYVIYQLGKITENANEGNDTVVSRVSYTLGDNLENLTFEGNGSNLIGIGNDSDNIMVANFNSSYLDGGKGADTYTGGYGNDTFIIDNVSDVVLTGGGGDDLVLSSVSYTLDTIAYNLTLTGTADINGTGNGRVNGNNGNNILTGLGGNDQLFGMAGNDLLDGGASFDQMTGSTGNDTYVVDDGGDQVIEKAGEGTDIVQTSVNYTLTDNVENLTLVSLNAHIGTGNGLANIITGNDGANWLNGLDGNDLLDGGLGADLLSGGAGNDTYVVDNTGDVVSEETVVGVDDGGTDLVKSSVAYTLTAHVENLTLTAATNIAGMGNELSNTLTGGAGNNTLKGMDGNDTLDGGLGSDGLDGGTGADRMLGGAGNDVYVVDNDGDRALEYHVAGVDDGGVDTVQSSISFHLGAYIENLTLTGINAINGTGNELDNTLIGNKNNNSLNGGLGADTMSGGKGDDTYYVDNAGDVVSENASEGTHDKVISSLSYSLTNNVENLTLTGTGDLTATGNNLSNVLVGNAGNNLIDGGASNDRMFGGAGNDTYIVDNDGDRVSEILDGVHDDGGIDTVMSSVTYHIYGFVENLTLTGTGNLNATGNALDNTLTGNAGNNGLNGGLGGDTLIGGLGDDTYYVDNSGDTVIENLNEGTADKVIASVSYALTDNVENLTLVGSSNLNATGNGLDNIIVGNNGNNRIDGGLGNDRLYGGLGSDTFAFSANSGADIIKDFSASQNDHINVSAYTHGTMNAALIHQSGLNTVIDFGGGNTITIASTTQADVLSHVVW